MINYIIIRIIISSKESRATFSKTGLDVPTFCFVLSSLATQLGADAGLLAPSLGDMAAEQRALYKPARRCCVST